MRYGSCYLSERRYVKHVPVTGARAARSPGHVRFNVGQKILRRSLVCAPDTDCPLWAGRARPEPHRTARQPVVGAERRTGDRCAQRLRGFERRLRFGGLDFFGASRSPRSWAERWSVAGTACA
jgi:hypothetical protein